MPQGCGSEKGAPASTPLTKPARHPTGYPDPTQLVTTANVYTLPLAMVQSQTQISAKEVPGPRSGRYFTLSYGLAQAICIPIIVEAINEPLCTLLSSNYNRS